MRNVEEENKVAGPVNTMHTSTNCSSLDVTFSDGDESLTAKGHADDCSDKSILSAQVAERAVLNGIDRMSRIPP